MSAPCGFRSQLQKVLVNGVELHYVERGSGPPLVLVHGGLGDYRSWEAQLEPFSRHFRVFAYSRRHSYPNRNPSAASDFSPFTEAADLAAFTRELQLGHVHLAGASYGGYAALIHVLQHPDMVDKLVLVEPPVHRWLLDMPDGKTLFHELLENVLQPARRLFARGEVEKAVCIFADGVGGAGTFDQLPPATRLDNANAIRALVNTADPFPLLARQEVRKLKTPTLLIEGERTTGIHRFVNDELLRCLPESLRTIIPQAAHSSARENPDAFNRAVLCFLNGAGY